MLIQGSNVMIMADTENQLIRKVDWGTQTVSSIVGNATVQGNCLDESCPSNSFKDGISDSATFTMPYSVQMHKNQKYALVADTRSNAIRKINLYTSTVHTVLRDRGYPTDVVSWGNKVAFCDGQNHTIWVYSNVDDVLMAQASGTWSLSNLAILSGGNSPTNGLYVEGTGGAGGSARFWEPLGITYDSTRDVLYVADYRNRVIRQVGVTTGAGNTVLKVGQQSQPAGVTDHPNALNAILAGPTNLRYHAATDAVYFSDRNPNSDDGAMRVWYVSTGVVKTIVGQSNRAVGDGAVTSGTVGVSAIWGVVVGTGWFGWTESDKHTLRLASDTSSSQAAAMPCAPGFYFSGTSCVSCVFTLCMSTLN